MDCQINWSPEALDDIDNIAEFHAKSDPLYAQVIVEELITKSRKIDRFPLRGRRAPELMGAEQMECTVDITYSLVPGPNCLSWTVSATAKAVAISRLRL